MLVVHAFQDKNSAKFGGDLEPKPVGVDDHVPESTPPQSFQVQLHQWLASHAQQRFRTGISEWAHALAASGSQQHGRFGGDLVDGRGQGWQWHEDLTNRLIQLEYCHCMHQFLGLGVQTLSGSGNFFNQRRILLRHLIHL